MLNNNSTPIIALPYPRGSFCLKRKTFERFFHNFWSAKVNPRFYTALTTGVMIYTTLNLYYMRKLPHKLKLFWPCNFWENYCVKITNYFSVVLSIVISPWIMVKTFIFTNMKSHNIRILFAILFKFILCFLRRNIECSRLLTVWWTQNEKGSE